MNKKIEINFDNFMGMNNQLKQGTYNNISTLKKESIDINRNTLGNLDHINKSNVKNNENDPLFDIFKDTSKIGMNNNMDVNKLTVELEGCIKDEIAQENNMLSQGWGLDNLGSISLNDDIEMMDLGKESIQPNLRGESLTGFMDDFFLNDNNVENSKKTNSLIDKRKEEEINNTVKNNNNNNKYEKSMSNLDLLVDTYEKEKTCVIFDEINPFKDVSVNLYNYHFWFTPIEITDENNLRKYLSRQIQIVYSVCKFFNSDRKFIDAHVNLLLQYLNFNSPKYRLNYFNELYLLRRIMKDNLNKSYKNLGKNIIIPKQIELEIVEKKLFESNGDIYMFKIMQQTVRQILKKKQLTLQEIFDKDLDYICNVQDIKILFNFLNIHDKKLVNVLFDILGTNISLHELCYSLNPIEHIKKSDCHKDIPNDDTKMYTNNNFMKEIDKYLKNLRFSLTDHTYFKVIWSGNISNQRIIQNSNSKVSKPMSNETDSFKYSHSESPNNLYAMNTISNKNSLQNISSKEDIIKKYDEFYIYEAENTEPKDRGMMSKNKQKIILGHYASNKPVDNTFAILEVTDISINSMYTSAYAQDILNLLFPFPKKYILLWHEDYSLKNVDECLHIWKPILSSSHFSNTTFLGFIATMGPEQPALNKIRAIPKSLVKNVKKQLYTTFYEDNNIVINNSGFLNSLNFQFSSGFDLQNYEELIFPNFSLNIVEKIKKIKYANDDIFNLWENDKQVQDDDESSSEWEVIPQCF